METCVDRHTSEADPVGAGTASPFPEMEAVLAAWNSAPSALIEILHAAQEQYGWLDRQLLGWLAGRLELPPSLVYGVAGFYHSFRLTPPEPIIYSVCTGTSCHLKGGTRLLQQLEQHLAKKRSAGDAPIRTAIEQVRCLGACGLAPLVRLQQHAKPDAFLGNVPADQAPSILEQPESVPDGMPGTPPVKILDSGAERFVLMDTVAGDPEGPFPGTYRALARSVQEMTPEEVCRQIDDSGLRGRGGGGYPTGRKWELVRQARGRRRYVVANGDEGDPGAFMDRTLMERDPHRVLEGMAIAAYAVGAPTGYVYVRGEYPLAAARLRSAIVQAEAAGMLGRNLFGSRFSFSVQVRIGAGAFVCGEETALMASIMGRRGQPVVRPPYPPAHGLWGYPTLINNVETFGAVPGIILDESNHFKKVGTAGSCGTKIFSISGDVARCGVVEVPLGTTLRALLERAGGVTGGAFKAAQTGGASGGCIPPEHLDLPIDYESLTGIGTIMGSGGLVVLNDTRCIVDIARFFMGFCSDESCGKCTPCRSGTEQARLILDRICSGEAEDTDLDRLEGLCGMMKEASLCGLGMAAPTPVLSTLRWYRGEYLAHIREKRCPAGVCICGGGT